MNKFLFVDDEIQLLEAIQDALRFKRREWDMRFVTSASEAIEHMKASPVDVIVSDMRMPIQDGASLLKWVSEHNPSTIRLILSGQATREATLQALTYSHQFLSKPCSPQTLVNVLEGLDTVLKRVNNPEALRIAGSAGKLGLIPAVYTEFNDLFNDPNISSEYLAAHVAQYPQVAGRMLQLANSAFFGAQTRVTSLSQAISYLGLDVLRAVLLGSNLFTVAETSSWGPELRHVPELAVRSAMLAMQLLPEGQGRSAAAMASMLKDIGLYIMAEVEPAKFAAMLADTRETATPFAELEAEYFGATHAEVGAHLLGFWGMPLALVEAVLCHHQPYGVAPESLYTVLATYFAEIASESPRVGKAELLSQLDQEYFVATGCQHLLNGWLDMRTIAA